MTASETVRTVIFPEWLATEPAAWLREVERRSPHPSRMRIARAFARSLDATGHQMKPTAQTYLAKVAGVSEAAAKRWLGWARDEGLIEPTGEYVELVQGKRRTPIYTAAGVAIEPPASLHHELEGALNVDWFTLARGCPWGEAERDRDALEFPAMAA